MKPVDPQDTDGHDRYKNNVSGNSGMGVRDPSTDPVRRTFVPSSDRVFLFKRQDMKLHKWKYEGSLFILEGEENFETDKGINVKLGFPGPEYKDTIYRGVSLKMGLFGKSFTLRLLF